MRRAIFFAQCAACHEFGQVHAQEIFYPAPDAVARAGNATYRNDLRDREATTCHELREFIADFESIAEAPVYRLQHAPQVGIFDLGDKCPISAVIHNDQVPAPFKRTGYLLNHLLWLFYEAE